MSTDLDAPHTDPPSRSETGSALPEAEFVRRVIHELRGQIAVSIGALNELGLRSETLAPAEARLIAMARRGSLRALRTADRFSRVLQLEGQPTLTLAPASLNALVQRAYADALPLEPSREIRVEFLGAPCSTEVSGDWAHAALVDLMWVALKNTRKHLKIEVLAPSSVEICTDGSRFELGRLEDGGLIARSGIALSLAFADVIARRHGGQLVTEALDEGVRCRISFGRAP